MPRDPNRNDSIPGDRLRIRGRKLAMRTSTDEVAAAIRALIGRLGNRPFTMQEVYGEMLANGTNYAELTVFKTMQRMKAPREATAVRAIGARR